MDSTTGAVVGVAARVSNGAAKSDTDDTVTCLGASTENVYTEFVDSPFPARTTVFVGLAPDMLVEIDALAVLD